MVGSMNRRTFIQSVGIAGMISLLGSSGSRASERSGDGTGPNGMGGPFGVAYDPSSGLIVTDPSRYRILRLDSANKPVSWFGGPGSEVGKLNYPLGVAVGADG